MFFYPLNKVFFQKNPFPSYFVRGQTFPHKVIQCLVANTQKFLRFCKSKVNALNVLFPLLFPLPSHFVAPFICCFGVNCRLMNAKRHYQITTGNFDVPKDTARHLLTLCAFPFTIKEGRSVKCNRQLYAENAIH